MPATFANTRTAAPEAVGRRPASSATVQRAELLHRHRRRLRRRGGTCTFYNDRAGNPSRSTPATGNGPRGAADADEPRAPAGQDRRRDQRARRRRRVARGDRELRAVVGATDRDDALSRWSTRSTTTAGSTGVGLRPVRAAACRPPATRTSSAPRSSTSRPRSRSVGDLADPRHRSRRRSPTPASRWPGLQARRRRTADLPRRREPLQVQGLRRVRTTGTRHRRRPGRLERSACAQAKALRRRSRTTSRPPGAPTGVPHRRLQLLHAGGPDAGPLRRRLHRRRSRDTRRASRRTRSAACPARSTTCSPTARRSSGSTGADVWNINSAESVAYEYSRYNYNATRLLRADPYRSCDHDPVVVGPRHVAATATPVDAQPARHQRLPRPDRRQHGQVGRHGRAARRAARQATHAARRRR